MKGIESTFPEHMYVAHVSVEKKQRAWNNYKGRRRRREISLCSACRGREESDLIKPARLSLPQLRRPFVQNAIRLALISRSLSSVSWRVEGYFKRSGAGISWRWHRDAEKRHVSRKRNVRRASFQEKTINATWSLNNIEVCNNTRFCVLNIKGRAMPRDFIRSKSCINFRYTSCNSFRNNAIVNCTKAWYNVLSASECVYVSLRSNIR